MWEGVAHRAGLIFTWLSGVFLERASGDTTVPTFSQQGQDDTPRWWFLRETLGVRANPLCPGFASPGKTSQVRRTRGGCRGGDRAGSRLLPLGALSVTAGNWTLWHVPNQKAALRGLRFACEAKPCAEGP